MLERVQHYFREVRGFKYDEVNAVLASGCGTIARRGERGCRRWQRFARRENFEPLAASFKRINNILKQANFERGGPSMLSCSKLARNGIARRV